MDIIRFLIAWGPTFLFIVLVLIGVLIGCLRGFRKSLILFIHMLIAFTICLIVYLCIVNNPNLDRNMVSFINMFLKIGNTNLQEIFKVEPECKTLHEMLAKVITQGMLENELEYHLVYDNIAYISTLVNMAYRCIIAVFCFILYFILIFFLYIIYLIAYPVRRKIDKINRQYRNGEIKKPYNRRRWAGCLIGATRSILTGIICFSFLGSLLFVITGGTKLPQRDELQEDTTVEFTNDAFNKVYDYYSYVCEMGNTGIFQVLNSVKDTSNTPFYFYFADLVLQGNLKDENLGAEGKFYLREDIGDYVHFANSTLALFLKYADVDAINSLMSGENSENNMQSVMAVFSNEDFAEEFSVLIDEFEGSSFMTNLCLSSLTSLINHINLVTTNENVIGIVNQLFKGEDSIKVTDLATEQDIKGLFKGVLQAIVDVDFETVLQEESDTDSSTQMDIEFQKQMILVAQKFLPSIQGLSLFNERKEVGNRIIKGLYTYCSTHLIDESIEITVPDDLDWMNEFNILFASCDSLLTMYYYCIDIDSKAMINNVLNMFAEENKYKEEMEAAYDALTESLTSSQILDVVFKSSLVGKQIDKLVVTITKQEDAKIPRDIDYVGKQGECAILLESLKILLQHDGGSLISTMLESEEGLSAESIEGLVEVFTAEIDYENQKTSLLKVILKSKMMYYMLSAYLTYAEFGAFKIYLSPDAVETIEDTQVIKRTEIDNIADLITRCKNLIIQLIKDPNNLNYAELLSDEYIQSTAEHSLLLQGTLSNVIIGIAAEQGRIVLPIDYDNPEEWISITQPDPEIMCLLRAVFELSKEKTEEGSYIINDLLNGSISPKVLLNLERKTIQTICKSKVLRYTVSDMVTDLGDTNFQIVVAYTSLETPNALTTTDKTVNVVKAEELSEIFIDIQTIILFDENDNVKINYNAIFKNKMEISQNKTIAATLIQAMYDNNEEGFLIIPENYTEDFEKIKTEENLEGNAWFGNIGNVLDDELYLMLNAVETLIDKDENGDIPNDFDFNTIQNNLKLRENCIDVICASVIMNASISNEVTKKFYVPTSSYGNQVILDKELDALFNAVFKMFDKTEIPLADLNDDLFNLMFRKDAIPIILNSKILVSTISKRMSNIDEIDIPRSVTTDTLYVEREEDGFIVHTSELEQLFTAMFVIFDTDTIMVNDMQQHLTGLELSKDSVDSITNSSILRATISTRLAEANQTVILAESVEFEELVDFIFIGSIRKEEFIRFLNGIFLIIHNDKIVIDEINQQMSSIVLSKEDISTILQSDILQSTISDKVTENDELIVPVSTTDSKLTIDGIWKNILSKEELNALIDAMFVLLNTENLELNALNTNLQTLILNQSKINAALQSVVLQATISNNFMNAESLTIPHIVLEPFYTIQYEEKEKIVYEELVALFAAIFATTDAISGKNFDLAEMALPTEEAQAESMVQSIIVSATLSNNITTQDSIVKVVDELRTNYFLNGQISIETYIDQQELASLLLALTNGLGKSNPKDLSIEDIHVPKTDVEKQALIGSEIIRTTISEIVLNQGSTYISSNSTHIDTSKHINQVSVVILTGEEILSIIRGIELLNPNEDKNNFDNLILDVGEILLMENKEEVLEAIANSDIYRAIISETLGKDTLIYGATYKAYEMFTTSQSTEVIESNPYVFNASSILPGRYVIHYPTTQVETITTFDLQKEMNFICERADVLALQFTMRSDEI